EIDYESRLLDPNEPNDKMFQATLLGHDYELEGVIDRADLFEDIDWFRLQVAEESLLQLKLEDIPTNRKLSMVLLDSTSTIMTTVENEPGATSTNIAQAVMPGTYYVKLSADDKFRDKMYRISAQV